MLTVFVDPQRCVGCMQCEFACAVEHSHSRDLVVAFHEDPVPRTRVHVQAGPRPNTAFPNKCRHCDPAPCLQVCPTGAIYRDDANDAVLVDTSRCIACAMCAMVCPFDVITYHALADGASPRTVAVKCDACIDRLHAGQIPACVEVCKVGALRFGELNDFVNAGQRRETAVVFAATTAESTPAVPDSIEAWRGFGATVSHSGGAR